MRAIRIASFALAVAATLSAMWPAARSAQAAAFAPQVSVWVSDDAPGSHPDITTTIEAASGPMFARTETLTPVGGSIAKKGDIPEGWTVGWIGGFVTIPGADGQCNQRFSYDAVDLVTANADASSFPPFLRDFAPGPHAARYTAEVAATPVNIVFDDVTIAGVPRLRATTYIGDPTRSLPTCAPFRNRVIMLGHVERTPPFPPVGSAPPTAGPRVYDFTFTSRDGQVSEQHVTATVQPGLQARLEPNRIVWNAVPGVASIGVGGTVTYTTTCELIRRLVIREKGGDLSERLAGDATEVALPPSPGAEYEMAAANARVIARDANGVLLAIGDVSYSRDFKMCWYPPGEEPVLHVAPDAGPCTGDVTFRGERFPSGVNVEITMPPYGSDVSGPRLAVAPVAADGTFLVTATFPESACANASMFPDGKMVFFTYNADEPHGMTIFASTAYTASIPPGRVAAALVGPAAGAGPGAARSSWRFAAGLAIAGAMLFGAGIGSRRKPDER